MKKITFLLMVIFLVEYIALAEDIIVRASSSKTIENMTVTVIVLGIDDACKAELKVDFNKAEILPLKIIFKNETEDRWQVRREDIILIDGKKKSWRPISAEQATQQVIFKVRREVSRWNPFNIAEYDSQREFKEFIQGTKLQDCTVLPYEERIGYLYFTYPPSRPDLVNAKLIMYLENREAKKESEFTIPLKTLSGITWTQKEYNQIFKK